MVALTCTRSTLADATHVARVVRCADGPVLHVVHVVCFVLCLWLQRRCVVLRPLCLFSTSGTLLAPNLSSVSSAFGACHNNVPRVLRRPIARFNSLVYTVLNHTAPLLRGPPPKCPDADEVVGR